LKPTLWYIIGRVIVRAYLKLFHRFEVVGTENVPVDGGLIIVSNHISHLDPPSMSCSFIRPVRFVTKQELFKTFFLSWYLKQVRAIPLKRGGGGKAMLELAADALREGSCVVLFPEGTRSKTGQPGRPRTGFLLLAAMAGAPILPVRISGSYDAMPPGSIMPRPGKIHVSIGEIMTWNQDELDRMDRDRLQTEADKVFEKIMELPGWLPKNPRPALPPKTKRK